MIPARVVVTGARGFLGGHLVKQARAAGSAVVAAGRRAEADMVALDEILKSPSVLDGQDALVHAAAIRHRHGEGASAYRASNIDLVETLMRACAGRVGRFVFVSSVGVYGFPRDLPI